MPALTGLLVDAVWGLESSGDEEADPDSAVKMTDAVVDSCDGRTGTLVYAPVRRR